LGTVDGEDIISRESTNQLAETDIKGDQESGSAMRRDYGGNEALIRTLQLLNETLSLKNQHALNRPIDWWLKCKPPQSYHIDWQVQSLEVFKPEIRDLSTKKKINKYLRDRASSTSVLGRPDLPQSLEEIIKSIEFADVQLMNTFHLFLNDNFSFVHKSKKIVDHPTGSRWKLGLTLNTPVSWIKDARGCANFTNKCQLVDLGARHRIM
jgi:hypothetical protein